MTARHLSAAEQRKYDKVLREQRHDKLMDRLEQFLGGVMIPETVTSGVATSDAGSPEVIPARTENPPELDAILEEMVLTGELSTQRMRQLVSSIRPIMEENARLKSSL